MTQSRDRAEFLALSRLLLHYAEPSRLARSAERLEALHNAVLDQVTGQSSRRKQIPPEIVFDLRDVCQDIVSGMIKGSKKIRHSEFQLFAPADAVVPEFVIYLPLPIRTHLLSHRERCFNNTKLPSIAENLSRLRDRITAHMIDASSSTIRKSQRRDDAVVDTIKPMHRILSACYLDSVRFNMSDDTSNTILDTLQDTAYPPIYLYHLTRTASRIKRKLKPKRALIDQSEQSFRAYAASVSPESCAPIELRFRSCNRETAEPPEDKMRRKPKV